MPLRNRDHPAPLDPLALDEALPEAELLALPLWLALLPLALLLALASEVWPSVWASSDGPASCPESTPESTPASGAMQTVPTRVVFFGQPHLLSLQIWE
jgi:hypothetical protein